MLEEWSEGGIMRRFYLFCFAAALCVISSVHVSSQTKRSLSAKVCAARCTCRHRSPKKKASLKNATSIPDW